MGTTHSLVDGRFILLIIPYFIGGVLCERKQLKEATCEINPYKKNTSQSMMKTIAFPVYGFLVMKFSAAGSS